MAKSKDETALDLHKEHQPRVDLNVAQAKAVQRGELDKALPAAGVGMDMDLPEPYVESPPATPSQTTMTDRIRLQALRPSVPSKDRDRGR